MRKGKFVGLASLVAAMVLPGLSQAQLLNGSFETPDATPTTTLTGGQSIGAWTVVAPTGNVALLNNAYLPPTQQASAGVQWVDLTGFSETIGNGVTQSFNSSHNDFFLVEFDLGRKLDRNPATLTVSFNGGPAQAFTNSDVGAGGNMDWNSYQYHFMGNGGNNTITFLGATPGADNTIGLDNVRVTAVPEPAAVAMMLASLGALAFVARRRKS